MFSRVGGNAGGHSVAYISMALACLVGTVNLARGMRPWKPEKVPILLLLPWGVVIFLASLHEMLWIPEWVLANCLQWNAWPYFLNNWVQNFQGWRSAIIAYTFCSAGGFLLLRHHFKPKRLDLIAFGGLIAVWFAIGLPTSLPLPNTGLSLYYSYVANGFEVAYSILFSLLFGRALR